jgi:uncharacterized protein YecE (DUF72 family)
MPPQLHVGTSGYAYKEWKGSFFPQDLPAKEMLRFYAASFGTVEINNTFYRLPKPSVLEAWAEQVPASFRFALKAPQRITHFQRLKDSSATLKDFLKVASTLKERLGPLLFQLPPNMKKDAPRLKVFLKLLPKSTRAAFEFRHQTWFDDETFELLREHKTALCIAEADDDIKCPLVATTDWGYLRLRKAKYTPAALKKWAQQVHAQPWRETYTFFKHEESGTAPKFAKKFLSLATP